MPWLPRPQALCVCDVKPGNAGSAAHPPGLAEELGEAWGQGTTQTGYILGFGTERLARLGLRSSAPFLCGVPCRQLSQAPRGTFKWTRAGERLGKAEVSNALFGF